MGQTGSEALDRLIEQDRLLEASTLLEVEGFSLFEREGSQGIARALQAIGVTAETTRARVLALKGLLESQAERADTAEAWFRLAIARAEDDQIKAELTYRFALDLFRSDRLGAIELLLPLADDATLPPDLRAATHATISQAHARDGDFNPANEYLASALELLSGVDESRVIANVHQQVAWVYLQLRELDEARKFARSSAALAEQLGLHDVLIRASTVLYTIAAEHDDYRQSLVHLEKIRHSALKTKNHDMEKYALIASCDIQTQRGDVVALVEIDASLSAFDIRYDADATEGLLPSQALRSAWRGDFTHAFRLLESTVERQASHDRQALRAAEVALYAAAMLDPNAPVSISKAIQKLEMAREETVRLARARCLTAVAYTLFGDLHAARAMLARVHAAGRAGTMALKASIAETIERFAGVQNHEALHAAYVELGARGYGGYVRLLEALPIASAMQTRFSRLNEADIASLRSYLRGTQLSEMQETSLCMKLQCERPANVLTLAMRYSPYPVPAAIK